MLLCLISVNVTAQNFMIITNNNVEDEVDSKTIKRIFLGKKTQWNNHNTIVFFVFSSDDVFDQFVRQFLGKSRKQFNNYWKRRVFTGKGLIPKSYDNIDLLIDSVRKTNGSISFIPNGEFQLENIRVLNIEK